MLNLMLACLGGQCVKLSNMLFWFDVVYQSFQFSDRIIYKLRAKFVIPWAQTQEVRLFV